MGDMKFALSRGEVGFGQCKAIVGKVVGGWEEGTLEGWATYDDDDDEDMPQTNGVLTNGAGSMTNGANIEDPDDGWGWEGSGRADKMELASLLDDCLAFGQ